MSKRHRALKRDRFYIKRGYRTINGSRITYYPNGQIKSYFSAEYLKSLNEQLKNIPERTDFEDFIFGQSPV